jgi:hypothetical protein
MKRPCTYCKGKGIDEKENKCYDCDGTGLVCEMCWRPYCECEDQNVPVCSVCGRYVYACVCRTQQ